jgi:kynurenine/2-aminoadipate aminotransferase
VLFLPGEVFLPGPAAAEGSPFIRAAYSTASEEQIDEALARLKRLLISEKEEAQK